jgi:hypothetical protein
MATQRASWGIGVIVAVLISLALLLFNVVNLVGSIALMFLLGGVWIAVFGVAFADASQRMFLAGWGLVIALLSGFAILPWQYALGLEVVGILVLVLLSVFMKPTSRIPRTTPPGSPSPTA